MSSSSWWVPLGAAAIALFGVVIGQVLSASTERRRQRSEVHQRTFEHWRGKRLELYGDFFRLGNMAVRTGFVWNNLSDKSLESALAAGEVGKLQYASEYLESIDTLFRNVETLRLVAPDSWCSDATEMHTWLLKIGAGIGNRSISKGHCELLIECVIKMLNKLRDAAREDLGIAF